MNTSYCMDADVIEVEASEGSGTPGEVVQCRPTVHSSRRNRSRSSPRHTAEHLHDQARVALIVSLLSLVVPLALPAGLFLGWRVRVRAQRSLPALVDWVSLPFYVAAAGLWLAAVFGIFGLGVFLVQFHA